MTEKQVRLTEQEWQGVIICIDDCINATREALYKGLPKKSTKSAKDEGKILMDIRDKIKQQLK